MSPALRNLTLLLRRSACSGDGMSTIFIGSIVLILLLSPPLQAQSGPPGGARQTIDEREADIFGPTDPEESDEREERGEEEDNDEEEVRDKQEDLDDLDRDGLDKNDLDNWTSSNEQNIPDEDSTHSDTSSDFASRLAAHDKETLEIGGGLFSQLQSTILDDGPALDFPLNQSNLLDIYLDARPNDRLRVFVDGRLSYSPTGQTLPGVVGGADAELLAALGASEESIKAELDQLWIKFDVARTLYITAGRQHLRWGVGRFWYPNDFLFDQRKDPLALFDVRTGVDIVKLHLPLEELGWNFYAVANLEGASTARDVGGALRAEFLVGLSEIGLSAAAQHDKPTQLGADISAGIGWFDVRASASLLHNAPGPFWRGESNFADFERIDMDNILQLKLPESYSRADDWIPRALVGAEVGIPYHVDDTLYIGAEYFYNGAGYADPEIYPWLLMNGGFRPLYNARHYAALYLLAPAPGNWNDSSISLATLGNLSDQSFLSRLDYSVNVLTHLRVFLFGSVSYGNPGELTLKLKIPAISADVLAAAEASGQMPVPEDMDLSQGFGGLSAPSTRASFGAGLRLQF